MIFVDTTALAALLLPSDSNHARARSWIEQNSQQEIVTTDYIIDELYTILLVRSKSKSWTIDAVSKLQSSKWISRLIFITREDFYQAEQLFLAYEDKGWSFTDCTCKIVIARMGISQAFAFDEHFGQFGALTVVPSLPIG